MQSRRIWIWAIALVLALHSLLLSVAHLHSTSEKLADCISCQFQASVFGATPTLPDAIIVLAVAFWILAMAPVFSPVRWTLSYVAYRRPPPFFRRG